MTKYCNTPGKGAADRSPEAEEAAVHGYAELASQSQEIAAGIFGLILGGCILFAIVAKAVDNISRLGRMTSKDLAGLLMVASGAFLVLFLVLAVFIPSASKAAAYAGIAVGVLFIGGLLFGS
ncbi:hypothetical protein [Streptomyces sp. NPDC002889]|uniref:hypothetical protein n=1 Tax=Streptomyces sp. NPDC002889 TaxID=3364669 RepID=UPI00369A7336